MEAVIKKSPYLSIRFAQKSDVQSVMKFIDKYWKSDHILSRDQELFEYLYLEKSGNLNFVIATEVSTGRDIAILGFIPTNSSRSRVSVALWKAINDNQLRSLHAGLASFSFLVNELDPRSLLCIGISVRTKHIYEFMGYSTCLMNHHFVLNQSLQEYKIIKNPPVFNDNKAFDSHRYSIKKILSYSDLKNTAIIQEIERCGKDVAYFSHRYIDHPKFAYEIIEVFNGLSSEGLLVYRRCFVNEFSCIRIIDIVGGTSCLKCALPFLVNEMNKNCDEYIDLVSWGLNRAELEQIGFIDRRQHLDCIVPDHFSPFTMSNKDIWCFSNQSDSEQLFKGDGDQDRPNL